MPTRSVVTTPQKRLVLELHVPCRDPIDHLMSMANHYGSKKERVVFNCTGVESDDKLLEREVERAYFDFERFSPSFMKKAGEVRLKCFRAIPVKPYIDYMGRFLQTRRISSEYYHIETNDKRDKSKECVYKLPANVQQKIRKILVKNHHYMKFCSTCIGSKMQLQL